MFNNWYKYVYAIFSTVTHCIVTVFRQGGPLRSLRSSRIE